VPTIFLSYRRVDSGGYAGRLADSLEKHFGKGSVFQDVETIVPGSNFIQAIDAAIARCQVLVVLIGNTWLAERNANGSLRLNDPDDFVRLEVGSGLRAGTHLIPVLVEGTTMPAESALTDDLKPLARLQAIELSDTRWDYDVERLAKVIRALTGGGSASRRVYLLAGIAALIATIAGVAGYIAFNQPPQIAGQWMLPNGSFWIVLQNGHQLTIEETHYDSKQVWKRGAGTADKNRVTFFLETIYGAPHRYEGTLTLSSDARAMSGTVRESNSERDTPLALTRAH
jgi:hypothetical protein